MAHRLLITLLIGVLQTAVPSVAGRWKSTVTPGPNEAPAIPAAFSVEAKDGKFIVTFDGKDTTPHPAQDFQGAAPGEIFLLLKVAGPGTATRTIVLRPAGRDQIREEIFFEYPEGNRNHSYFYSEVFKRVQ